jgi:NAD(P)-dependent dehydrogenase (short-subunit alcohol dehydrogenase family)
MALLAGLNAVVTGSTKGIGRGIAPELAREGARVLIHHRGPQPSASRSQDEQETLRLIRDAGGPPPFICEADMGREDGARRLAESNEGVWDTNYWKGFVNRTARGMEMYHLP